MSNSLSLGNGNILVCMDRRAQVRDLYFPYVGLENHLGGHYAHRVGVFADHQLNWFGHPNWNINTTLSKDSLVGETTAHNSTLGVTLSFADTVYNEKNIFLRAVTVKNNTDRARTHKTLLAYAT